MRKFITHAGVLHLCTIMALVAGCTQTASTPELQTSRPNSNERAAAQLKKTQANGMVDHAHIPIAVPEGVKKPTLSLDVSRDQMSGFNLVLYTEHYVITPPPAGLSKSALIAPTIDPASGFVEGHAHLHINGVKIQRIYGSSLHLPETLFRPGLNQIHVTINNHGHMYWTANDRQIMATLFINVDNQELVTHRFESSPMLKSADGSMCTTQSQDS